MSNDFPKTNLNQVRRKPERGHYDKETTYQIIDAALIGHVGLIQEGQPVIISTIIARDEDQILLHGASSSRLLRYAASGKPLCISVTHLDGLVLARSVFHHSMNYRSVVVFGSGQLIDEPEAKMLAMKCFTEKLIPGRWGDARQPTENEIKATAIVSVDLSSGSAKIRVGPPGDDEEDYALPIWAGVLPIRTIFGELEADPKLGEGIEVPEYLRVYAESKR